MKNLFGRFVSILKPNFLVENFNENDSGKTWKFWFFSNSMVAILFTVIAAIGIVRTINSAGEYLQANYLDAKVSVVDGKLSTDGFTEPIYIKSDDGSLFVVDTKGAKYDESVLDGLEEGVFISSAKIFNKKSLVETQQFDISQAKTNFSITQKDLQSKKTLAIFLMTAFIFVFGWIYLNLFRLVSALWWTLCFWLLGTIMKVEKITFSKVYFSVLNFYIVPLVISLLFLILGITIPFLTFVIFLILFIVNYLKLNKENKLKIESDDVIIEEAK